MIYCTLIHYYVSINLNNYTFNNFNIYAPKKVILCINQNFQVPIVAFPGLFELLNARSSG